VIKLSLTFKGKLLKVYQLKQELVKIGRSDECDVAIDNLGFLPVHAVIEIKGETATLINSNINKESEVNNSIDAETNSEPPDSEMYEPSDADAIEIRVNDIKTDKHVLEHQDIIQLGKYALKFTREIDQDIPHAEATFPKVQIQQQGWLQIMNGPKLGQTIKLENPMVRLGKAGKACAMISNRDGNYFISHLEGEPRTKVKNQEVAEARISLVDGDTLQVGETKMLFFMQ